MNNSQEKLNTVALIFSKDRPLQLELTIRTFEKYCEEFSDIPVYVLYKPTTARMSYAYTTLEEKTLEKHPNIKFWEEKNFKNDVNLILDNFKYILFCVDDSVFLRKFSLEDITSALKTFRGMLGFSLRLGENTQYCYSLNLQNTMPKFKPIGKTALVFNWKNAGPGDFSYPLELSSSVYRIKDIRFILEKTIYENPNDLEWVLSRNATTLNNFSYLGCKKTSIAVSLPINKVQTVNNNRVSENPEYTAKKLLEQFENGYVIDDKPFRNFISNSCHQEVDIKFKYV